MAAVEVTFKVHRKDGGHSLIHYTVNAQTAVEAFSKATLRARRAYINEYLEHISAVVVGK